MKTAAEFWAAVDKTNGCWYWKLSVNSNGYPKAYWNRRLTVATHVAYFLTTGLPVPAGMVIDHVCHNQDLSCRVGSDCLHRRCVRPDHLDLTTHSENVKRGRGNGLKERTHCKRGHPLDLVIVTRACSICRRVHGNSLMRQRRYRARHLSKAAGGRTTYRQYGKDKNREVH